jgi:hypothetical protein
VGERILDGTHCEHSRSAFSTACRAWNQLAVAGHQAKSTRLRARHEQEVRERRAITGALASGQAIAVNRMREQTANAGGQG